MALVNVTVNNRLYEVGCDDGEEDQVRRLSGVLDRRVRELAALVGQVGEARLMLMTALTLADDLEQAQRDVAEMRQAVSAMQTEQKTAMEGGDALVGLAKRLEDIAARLEST
ncbi:cell division protein ZapA [Ferrovibrio sp.]|uniref:cell division protein ZapA n=1 Tax=Ferrovibrio sp. TaxID=1917215 RepID=UPI000CC81292|nr:cell division protein ZapA [Ferrovibrio sp.]PJI42085.1 MAG: cell division protein ZapA [Ferrovibrio sp.]